MESTQIRKRKRSRRVYKPHSRRSLRLGTVSLVLLTGLTFAAAVWWFHDHYTLSLQSPVRFHLQSPIVVAERVVSGGAAEAQADQHGRRLSAWQQYACRKFGTDCRLALAIQRAENPQGKCEIYPYNSDGTLDWATSRSTRFTSSGPV